MLTLCIDGFDVHKVLVDPGIAADLLQLLAFKKTKLSLGMQNSAGRILYGFNGATTVTLGNVTLLVKAGLVTQQILFSIVEDLGPYNAIMWRAWLHWMKVVPSTYHQMISYLTNVGQVNLLSSQLATRQCYQISIHEQRGEKNSENPPSEIKPCHRNHSSLLRWGGRKGPVGCGSLGKSDVGRVGKIHLRQFSSIQ